MSARARRARLAISLGWCALLGACSVEPPKPPPKPAVVIPRPAAPPNRVTPLAGSHQEGPWWTDLVASFVLQDCADSRQIHAKEALYTRYGQNFERLLRQSLPLMQYVDKQLRAAGIPGEFVMLPMVEASYQASATGIHGAAGMWQLMRHTAHLHGVVMRRGYHGRRDPVASTRAAIAMLTSLEKRFGSWQLADMAYNAGPQTIVHALRKHPDLGPGAIPDIPVSTTTRDHLAELMALACIVRQPARFHIKLPTPNPADALHAIRLQPGTRLADAAAMAGIPEKTLRALNPGYRGKAIPKDSPRTLLLPRAAAESLAATLATKSSAAVAQAGAGGPTADPPGDPPPPADAATARHGIEHRVRKGESLWSIAHHYHVRVSDLKRWNQLDGDILHPGEVLRIRH